MSKTYSMLPEWAPQDAVLLAWPHAGTDWAPWIDAIQRDYVALAVAIAAEATPLILCQDAAHQQQIAGQLKGLCKHAPRIVIAPFNDTWCRDYGPITLARGKDLQLLDFQFRGWGNKYAAGLDNDINQRLDALWKAPLQVVHFELEGGSIETDGRGTLLTTTHCLLDSNRNRALSRKEVENLVLTQLGLERVLWLQHGMLIGDDTDSHIDNLVRFCDEHTLAYAACSRVDDPHFEPLQAMAADVRALRQPNGKPYRLQPVELPAPQFDEKGKRLPASYVNFLIVNGSVLVPVFDCAEDAPALAAMQQCFPGRRVVAVPGRNLIKQYGGPHCATMQLPVNTLKPLKEGLDR